MSRSDEIREFGRRVERLCEFLLDKVEDSDERDEIIKIKEESQDIQYNPTTDLFVGLSNHIQGLPEIKKE